MKIDLDKNNPPPNWKELIKWLEELDDDSLNIAMMRITTAASDASWWYHENRRRRPDTKVEEQ